VNSIDYAEQDLAGGTLARGAKFGSLAERCQPIV
jgi:hypothetical protein